MGIGCEPWPACYGRIQTAAPSTQTRSANNNATSVKVARLLHRAAAMTVAILAVLTLLLGLTGSVRNVRNASLVASIVALTAMLAAVGRMSATLLVPAVGVTNLLGGFGLLACFWALYRTNCNDVPLAGSAKRVRCIAGFMLLVFALHAAVGALISVTYSADVCPSLWICTAAQEPGHSRDLNLFEAQPLDVGGKVIAAPAAASMQTTHRVLGVASAALFALFGLWLVRFPALRMRGVVLLALALIEGGIGIVMAAHGFPLLAAITHNAVAASLLLVLVGLVWPRTSPSVHARSD
uniref:Putative cytochrome oxidase assembly protein n=1 Tax=uncultured bacterium 888 TaxID=548896 RepID=B8R8N8_9BACT|nr:putative cytochrome oxidase assembly protein [uncultured bacterium 888]